MYDNLKKALLSVTQKTYHYFAPSETTGEYIVWAEDGQDGSLYGDGKMNKQVITGTVDYFSKTENDPNFEKIQEAFKKMGIAFYLSSIQFEKETRCIHYEWVWEVIV